MISQTLDLTSQYNANNGVVVDTSGWQNITVLIDGSLSGSNNITGTSDAGAITGTSDGNPLTATNFTAIQATDLSSGAAVTSISVAGNFKIINPPKFVKIGGASAATDGKVIIYLTTPV
ncbi:MAG TPA: hypothetical protein VIM07_00815 [Chitinophagaceae bacterium]